MSLTGRQASPSVFSTLCERAGFGLPISRSPDVRLRPPGSGSLGFACAAPGGCRAVAAVPASATAYGRRAEPVSHTLSVRAGGPGEHQPTEVGQANSGTMPGVRVKMAPLVKYAGERDTGSPNPPSTGKGEAAETVGAMRKSRRADTRLTPSAPSQLRRN